MKSTSDASSQQQPQDHQAYEIQQAQSNPVVVENNGGNNNPKDEPRPPESLWVISIKENIQQARQDNKEHSWENRSVYRIPHNFRDGNDEGYVPHIVSLGPYHHGDEHLRQMDQHKWRSLDYVLRRTKKKIDLYLDSVKEVEKEARECYEGTISMSSDEFVQMMVLDGCFVIELLLGYGTKDYAILGYHPSDPVFSMRGLMHIIRRDMIMLENQIPLFILDMLLGVQRGDPNQTGLVARLAHLFFAPLNPAGGQPVNLDLGTIQGKFHCLGVFRESLLHHVPEWVETEGLPLRQHQPIHCVMDLRKAGVKFRKRETDVFWDIQFEDGILQIPPLVINNETRSLFLNLIAFEQCHVNCGKAITSYVTFMDYLINSPEDVGHLRDHGIIEHWLGSDTEVAELFNLLCKEVVFDIKDSYLYYLYPDVYHYCFYQQLSFRAALALKWNSWKATLKSKYFDNPWSIMSIVAAFVLLVLTFLQSLYAVYGYYR